MKKKTAQQKKCGKRRQKLLKALRGAIGKSSLIKIKLLFGISE